MASEYYSLQVSVLTSVARCLFLKIFWPLHCLLHALTTTSGSTPAAAQQAPVNYMPLADPHLVAQAVNAGYRGRTSC